VAATLAVPASALARRARGAQGRLQSGVSLVAREVRLSEAARQALAGARLQYRFEGERDPMSISRSHASPSTW
jgi:hypothetical protein